MSETDDILIALRRITRAIDLHSKKLVKVSGLTAPQLLIMQSVRKEGAISVSRIAADVCLSQGTVTSVLDRLERAGYVRRERSKSDRRVVNVCLTGEGQAKLEQAPELLQSGFLREFGALEPWERKMLVSSIERIALMMNAEEIDASPILEVGEIKPDGTTTATPEK